MTNVLKIYEEEADEGWKAKLKMTLLGVDIFELSSYQDTLYFSGTEEDVKRLEEALLKICEKYKHVIYDDTDDFDPLPKDCIYLGKAKLKRYLKDMGFEEAK
jgi:hypothetical protein